MVGSAPPSASSTNKPKMILLSGPASMGDLLLMIGVWIGIPYLLLYLLFQWYKRRD
jgi:hypothetical protein